MNRPSQQRPHRTAATAGRYPSARRLEGRRILVMGAGQNDDALSGDDIPTGIGRAIAQLLAREGAAVGCVDIDHERAAATATLIAAEGGIAAAFTGDASDEPDVKRVVTEATDQLGGLDGLVLNVGGARGGTLEETSLADFDDTLKTNLSSQFLGLKHAMPGLAAGGAVVMISAIAAIRIGPTPLPYDASKAALEPLMRHGARSGEPNGVRVNMVLPGAIKTPMAITHFGGHHDLGWGREGSGWETAHAVLFLLSDESSYVNATTLVVDGGMTALH